MSNFLKIFVKILIITLIFLFPIFVPKLTAAATIPYTITEGMPSRPVSLNEIFFTTSFTLNYQSGTVVLSSRPDGTGDTVVDDIIHIGVIGPDGRTRTFGHLYATPFCRGLAPLSPFDLANLFRPGVNMVSVFLRDGCGVFGGSSPLYLVNLSAPDPSPTPTPTPTPSPTPAPKTPLILIPGIGGSELKVNEDTVWSAPDGHGGVFNHSYTKDEKVWVNEGEAANPGQDDYFDVLRMKPDGVTSEANLILNGTLFSGYQETINFFISNGYTLNQDFFIFPYDWRMDNTQSANLLDQKIQAIKSQTGNQKVDIIAHSMGGLIARSYISDSSKSQNVRKLFSLGIPHLGSVESIKSILYGSCLTTIPQLSQIICLGIPPSEANDVIQNMISIFELATTQSYFSFYNNSDNQHPYPYKNNFGALNYQQIKNLLTSLDYNTSLFTPSETFHNLDNNLTNTNGVDVTVIAGSGIPTLGQIIERQTTDFFGNKTTHKDEVKINGDDTVPLFSASLNDPSKNLSLLGNAKLFYTKQNHGSLVTSGPALQLVKNILNESTDIPTGISSQPYAVSGGSLLSVHSPVNIHVYDSNGNHTGPTSDGFEANIPGSSYDSLDDAKFIYLPDDGNYTIKFEATDSGSFDFKIRKFENDQNSETILYNDIPLSDATKAETEFDTSSAEPPILQIDQDGNGTTDTTVTSTSTLTGDDANDLTAPETEIQLSGTEGLNGWHTSNVTVTLNGQDEMNGSGILKTEYTLDGQTINTYTEPFTVSTEGVKTLKVRSIDNAGNEENAKEIEIKIDKIAPEAKVFVDPDKLDLIVDGVDANTTTVASEPNNETRKRDDAIYTITDVAGNTTRLDVRERDKEKKDRFRIHSIKYSEENPIELSNNYFNVSYNGKKDKLNVNEQNFELKKEVKIRIKYDSKKNKSTIIVKEPKQERVKEVRDGLILLQLLTNKGQLETSY